MRHIAALLLCISTTVLFSQQSDFPKLTGPYLGQKLPGMTPEIFAPGIVSTGMSELNSVFSPDGREFYFCVRTSPTASIFRMQLISGRWSKPDLLPFASRYGDLDVSISVDGARLFFCSKRPVAAVDSPRADHDIWMSLRKDESWGEPIHLGQAVNSNREDFYPTTARNGNLYFNSQREGEGTNNIYVSRQVSGKYTPAEKLGPEINIGSWNFDPCIGPDERFLIFSSNRSGGFGASDLYISFRREDGSWTPAKNMGGRINTVGPEFCAMLSPDGKYLFFTSSGRSVPAYPDKPLGYSQFFELHNRPRNASTDIYWIDAAIIDELSLSEARQQETVRRAPQERQPNSELKSGEALIWYLGHCGYAVRTQNHLLIFDYQELRDGQQPKTRPSKLSLENGWINPEEIKDLSVRVFASHSHDDHYDPVVLEWKKTIPDIQYSFGWKAGDDTSFHYLVGRRAEYSSGGLDIATINSHHSGVPEVAWLVKVDGLVIYHNGDCQPEDAVAEYAFLKTKADRIDVAFLSPVYEEKWKYGTQNLDLFRRFSPRLVFPMHATAGSAKYTEVEQGWKSQVPGLPVVIPRRMGERFAYNQKTNNR